MLSHHHSANAWQEFWENAHDSNRETPVFWGHGSHDGTVTYPVQAVGVALLQRHAGVAVTHRSYPMQHSSCNEEIGDLRRWLEAVLA